MAAKRKKGGKKGRKSPRKGKTVPLRILENRAAYLVDLVERRGGTPRRHGAIKHRRGGRRKKR